MRRRIAVAPALVVLLLGGCGGGGDTSSTASPWTKASVIDIALLEGSIGEDTGHTTVNCEHPSETGVGAKLHCTVANPLGNVPIVVTQENKSATRFYYTGRIKKGGVTLRYDSHITLPGA
jgi:alanine dehydrogenase